MRSRTWSAPLEEGLMMSEQVAETALDEWAAYVRGVEDGATRCADYAADLIARGASLRSLGNALGVTRQTVTDRFSWTSPSREAARAVARARAWLPDAHTVRLSAFGRFVVFYDGQSWRVLRHTPNDAAAFALAEVIAAEVPTLFRLIRKPRDLDEGFSWWRLPNA